MSRSLSGGGHYTYLEATRPSVEVPFQLLYQDSLASESTSCYTSAIHVARALGILGPSRLLPHSSSGIQNDAWTCGLWVLQMMETRIRQWRGEVLSRPPTTNQIMTRLNEFIHKLRPADPQPVGKGNGRARAKAKPLVQHESLQAALEAALACSKCKQTSLGQKGCSQCMGKWFDQIRTRKVIKGEVCVTPVYVYLYVYVYVYLVLHSTTSYYLILPIPSTTWNYLVLPSTT